MKLQVKVFKDENGRVDKVHIFRAKKRKPLRLQYIYDSANLLREVQFDGRKGDMPSISEIMDLVNEKFMERIGVIKKIELVDLITQITDVGTINLINTIDLINTLSEITTIKTIESISSLPNIVIEGSEGVSFKQASAGSGTWISPDGNADPDSGWNDEAKAHDGSVSTYAYSELITANTWTKFLYVTFSTPIKSNKLQFNVSHYYADSVDVDAKIDGAWVDVFEGFTANDVWIEKSFTEGIVDEIRIRFFTRIEYPTLEISEKVNEIIGWRVPTTGGEMLVHVTDVTDEVTSIINFENVTNETKELVAATALKRVKIYSYEIVTDADGEVYMTGMIEAVDRKFARRNTKGHLLHEKVKPIILDANKALSLVVPNGVLADVWVQYKKEE